jgi:hypothetical protein
MTAAIRRFAVLLSALTVAALWLGAPGPAGAATGPAPSHATATTHVDKGAIGPSAKLVGTYDVGVLLAPGGEYDTGQMTLSGDGTWTGDMLAGSGCGTDSGTWLSAGKVLALADTNGGCTGYGMTWMITVGKHHRLGSATSTGYVNSPYVFNGTWDAVRAPAHAPEPTGTSTVTLASALVGTYDTQVVLGGDSRYSGTITLNDDGSWGSRGLVCQDFGTWLSSGKVVALSDDSSACSVRNGMSWMATIGSGPSFGSSKKPGYLNNPYVYNASWWATAG